MSVRAEKEFHTPITFWLIAALGPLLTLFVLQIPEQILSPYAKTVCAHPLRIQSVLIAICLAVSSLRPSLAHMSFAFACSFVLMSGSDWTWTQVALNSLMFVQLGLWLKISWDTFGHGALAMVVIAIDLLQRVYVQVFDETGKKELWYLTCVALPEDWLWLKPVQVIWFCLPLCLLIGLKFLTKPKQD